MASKATRPHQNAIRFGREKAYNFDCLEEFLRVPYAPEPCRTIHIGCGDGRTSVYLAQKGYQILGIDPERDLLAAARERAVMAAVHLDLMAGDPLALPPLPEESFGLALDFGTAAEMSDGLTREDYLRKIFKLLMRDGILLAAGPEVPRRTPRRKGESYAYSGPFVSDFTRAGFDVVFEGVQVTPPGDERLIVHARKPNGNGAS